MKWLDLKSKYYRRCPVTQDKHSRYELVSQGNRAKREKDHVRRLMLLKPRTRNTGNCMKVNFLRSSHPKRHSGYRNKEHREWPHQSSEKTSLQQRQALVMMPFFVELDSYDEKQSLQRQIVGGCPIRQLLEPIGMNGSETEKTLWHLLNLSFQCTRFTASTYNLK